MNAHIRIARPVSFLEKTASMYCKGLSMKELGRFQDHNGFDGIMIGSEGAQYHFEFTFFHDHPIKSSPTMEDLIVIYISSQVYWKETCEKMLSAGFTEVDPFNPYWKERGRSFEDHDKYRVVIECDSWENTK